MNDRLTLTVLALTSMATAGTADITYACHGQPGEWELETAYFVPDDDRVADGTNYATLGVAQGAESIGSFTTAATGLTEGTPRAFTLAKGLARIFGASDAVKLSKAVAGTGLAITGKWCLAFKKVQADAYNTTQTS